MSTPTQIDFTIHLDGGKYTIIRLVGGETRWLRYGEPWEAANREFAHAKAINALIDRVNELECMLAAAGAELK